MRYPQVSINGGTDFRCYLEMDGIDDRTNWQARFEVTDPNEFEALQRAHENWHLEEIKARVLVAEGVAFQGAVSVYVRVESDFIGGAPTLDVTLNSYGKWEACPS